MPVETVTDDHSPDEAAHRPGLGDIGPKEGSLLIARNLASRSGVPIPNSRTPILV